MVCPERQRREGVFAWKTGLQGKVGWVKRLRAAPPPLVTQSIQIADWERKTVGQREDAWPTLRKKSFTALPFGGNTAIPAICEIQEMFDAM